MILIFPASQHYRSFATTSSRHIYSSICPVITTNWNWCRKHLRKFMWLITVSLPPMLSRLQRIKADYWKILYFWNYWEERIRLAIIYSITTLAMTVRQTFFYRRHYRSSVKLTATFTEIGSTYRNYLPNAFQEIGTHFFCVYLCTVNQSQVLFDLLQHFEPLGKGRL